MIEKDNKLKSLIGKQVVVIHSDSFREFKYVGVLTDVTDRFVFIEHPVHGQSIISLDSIKKMHEAKHYD